MIKWDWFQESKVELSIKKMNQCEYCIKGKKEKVIESSWSVQWRHLATLSVLEKSKEVPSTS